MNDPIHDLLTEEGQRWRSSLDPDPDVTGLLPAGSPRRRVLPAMVAASVAVLVVAAAAIAIATRASRHDATASHASTATHLADPVRCTRRLLHAPGITSRPATRAQLETFRPVAAVECAPAQRRYPDGVWSVMLRQVTTSPVDALVAALDRPDTTTAPGKACLNYVDVVPPLVLVEASGHLLRPRYPRDGCGHLQVAVRTALKHLTWHTMSITKVSLDVPNDPILRTCQRGWKNMIQMEGPRRQLSTGGTLASTGTAIACIYRTDGDPIAGDYSRGAQLNQTQATSLATALSGPGQPGTCPPQSQFAVIHLGHRLAYVELGGCGRVLRPDDTLGRADITTVQRILNP